MMITEMLLLLSTGSLGIFLGAQIAEAVLLVPFWKSLSPDDFFRHHQEQAKKIYQFFAPLTIIATLLPLLTVAYYFSTGATQHQLLFALMGVATIAFFSSYFLFFKKANRKFAQRRIPNEALASALTRWGQWHWGRIIFEAFAFVFALYLLLLY